MNRLPQGDAQMKRAIAAAWLATGVAGLLSSWPVRTGLDRVTLALFAALWAYGGYLLLRRFQRAPHVLAEVIRVPVERVLDNPFRIRVVPDSASLDGLARSIAAYGMLEPVLVRPRGDKYELISGQRRFLAAKRLGRAWVPALVRSLSDKEMLEVGLLDNVQRRPLSQVEEARAFARLSREFESISEKDLTDGLGLDAVWVGERERLLALPDVVQQAVILGTVTDAHAQALADLNDPDIQIDFLKRICEERWDAAETARRVSAAVSGAGAHASKPSGAPPGAPDSSA